MTRMRTHVMKLIKLEWSKSFTYRNVSNSWFVSRKKLNPLKTSFWKILPEQLNLKGQSVANSEMFKPSIYLNLTDEKHLPRFKSFKLVGNTLCNPASILPLLVIRKQWTRWYETQWYRKMNDNQKTAKHLRETANVRSVSAWFISDFSLIQEAMWGMILACYWNEKTSSRGWRCWPTALSWY